MVEGGTSAVGVEYLAENAKRDGVVATASGLQYRVLRSGPNGGPSPNVSSMCVIHYNGSLIDGTPFDSSYDRGEPVTRTPNMVLPGWREALQLMKAGDKWELTLPSELGYGDRDMGEVIKAGDVLVFEVELLELKGPAAAKSKMHQVGIFVAVFVFFFGKKFLMKKFKFLTGGADAVKPTKGAAEEGKPQKGSADSGKPKKGPTAGTKQD